MPHGNKEGTTLPVIGIPRGWDIEDGDAVSQLMQQAVFAYGDAIQKGDQDRIREIHELVMGLMQLHDLMQAFRKNPRASIKKIGQLLGKGKKGLSRNGVYFRLDMVGLDAVDLRSTRNMMDLALKGKLRRLVKRIQAFQTGNVRVRSSRRSAAVKIVD